MVLHRLASFRPPEEEVLYARRPCVRVITVHTFTLGAWAAAERGHARCGSGPTTSRDFRPRIASAGPGAARVPASGVCCRRRTRRAAGSVELGSDIDRDCGD